MKEIIIGLVSGIVSGTGMGGGTILIFLLSYMLGIEQHIAQATNLIFFIPTALMAIIVNFKNKNIDIKAAILISVFGILGAIIGANISIHIEVGIKISKKSKNRNITKSCIKILEVKKMKFVKGVMIGGLITTGLMMMYAENDMMNKKKLMKKGKQIAKKMGIM